METALDDLARKNGLDPNTTMVVRRRDGKVEFIPMSAEEVQRLLDRHAEELAAFKCETTFTFPEDKPEDKAAHDDWSKHPAWENAVDVTESLFGNRNPFGDP
jgi:hypothetical protein